MRRGGPAKPNIVRRRPCPLRRGTFAGVTADPLGLADDIQDATTRLLRTANGLTDSAAASRLPDWTVGHVLTHIARNADGLTNLLTWACTGVVTPQYASREARVADIEAGAHRPIVDQIADLASACDRFAAAVDAMPPEAWVHQVRPTLGSDMPAAQVMWSRLREVEIHHVDIGAVYAPADWPQAFTVRMVHLLTRDMADRADAPRVLLRVPEIGHDLHLGSPDGSPPVVSGPAWAVVAWLTGRSGGEELTGALPPVPVWR
jgi:maleylpyruvate isomerase